MTIETLLSYMDTYRRLSIVYLAALPTITVILGFLHGVYDGRKPPWRQLYSLIVYLTTLPVTAVAAAGAYIYSQGGDPLAAAGITIPALLLASWLLTLLFVKRVVDLRYLAWIPGIVGFVIELLVIWGIGLFVYWADLWFVFGNAFYSLFAASAIAYVVLNPILTAFHRRSIG